MRIPDFSKTRLFTVTPPTCHSCKCLNHVTPQGSSVASEGDVVFTVNTSSVRTRTREKKSGWEYFLFLGFSFAECSLFTGDVLPFHCLICFSHPFFFDPLETSTKIKQSFFFHVLKIWSPSSGFRIFIKVLFLSVISWVLCPLPSQIKMVIKPLLILLVQHVIVSLSLTCAASSGYSIFFHKLA